MEEILHLFSDDWPLVGNDWLTVTAMVMTLEEGFMLICHVIGKLRVNEENRCRELLLLGVDGLPVFTIIPKFDLWHDSENWIFDCSLRGSYSLRNKLIAHEMRIIGTITIVDSGLTLTMWSSKVWIMSLEARIFWVVRILTK